MYPVPLVCRNQIDNYLVRGVGSEFFTRNSSRFFCNHHTWNPDVCQYQLTPAGNPTVSSYHIYHKVNIGERVYEQKWTFDSVQKSWVPLKSDGTAWPQGLQVQPDDVTNPVYPQWYGQYPHLGYRSGSPDLPLIYERTFVARPTPAAIGSPVALTDGYTVNDSLVMNGGWSVGEAQSSYFNMVAEGTTEVSEGYYGPASVWDRTCVRCPKMYRITQKLIQHIVSADGFYDFEEVLYPVAEYPWSPLHNNARAFSWSRYPGKTLFDAAEVKLEGVTEGSTSVALPIPYDINATYWNQNFFGSLGFGESFTFNPLPFSYGKLGTPYRWNPDRGPSSPFEYHSGGNTPDLGSSRIASPELGIQFSLDQRWRRWIGDTYGAWSGTNIIQPVIDPLNPVVVRGGYSFPNYVGLGYVKPDYPVPSVPFRTLPPELKWNREEASDPDILTTLGRNRWTTINPVVYFFRDYLWIDGKYRLCDITITEGNDDYQWTAPEGYTNLGIMPSVYRDFTNESWPSGNYGQAILEDLRCDDRFADGTIRPKVLNSVSHIRYPIFQLVGTSGEGTYTFGGQIGTSLFDPTINPSVGIPNGYSGFSSWTNPGGSGLSEWFAPRGDALLPNYLPNTDTSLPNVGDGWAVRVPNGYYELICLQMPAFKINGGDWQELKATGSWPRYFAAWGADMKYLFQYTDSFFGGVTGFGSVGPPDINSGHYFLNQFPNSDYKVESPDYIPFTGIRGGTRTKENVKMVGATVQVYGHPTDVAPPAAGWPLVATTTTDFDGAWEVSYATPGRIYVVVDGRYDNASGVPGDSTYYGLLHSVPGYFEFPVDPPVIEVNLDVHVYQPRF